MTGGSIVKDNTAAEVDPRVHSSRVATAPKSIPLTPHPIDPSHNLVRRWPECLQNEAHHQRALRDLGQPCSNGAQPAPSSLAASVPSTPSC